MTIETFPFIFYTPKTIRQSVQSVEFGRGYVSTVRPFRPLPRRFELRFPEGTMLYLRTNAGIISSTVHPQNRNFRSLEEFYDRHGTWETFLLDHQSYGVLSVKFTEVIDIPDTIKNSPDALSEFTLKVVEVPA
jgi:phage-related protein